MKFNIVICIGDSVTYGARDEQNSSYPSEMESILEQIAGGWWICLNEGVLGETTSDLIRRFYKSLRSNPEAYEVCLFEGVNDSKDSVNTLPEKYEKNLEHCIRSAEILRKKLFLGTIPKIKGVLAPNYSARSNDRIEKYNEIIGFLCEKYSVRLVELSDLDENVYADGVHFTNQGHKEIARRFAASILNERGLSFK